MKSVEFLNCHIDLREKVLVPRIETEFWVKKVINTENTSRHIKVLDIFSGSGCIGIAVLKNIKNSHMDFADIDKSAIKQIKINLKLNKIPAGRYKIYKSDIFKKLAGKTYDAIFANPPYVAEDRINEVQPSVLKYEPHVALFSGKKGLDMIKKFLKQAKKHLTKNGALFMEFDPLQKKDIKNILEKFGYNNLQFFKDQFDKWRYFKVIHT